MGLELSKIFILNNVSDNRTKLSYMKILLFFGHFPVVNDEMNTRVTGDFLL